MNDDDNQPIGEVDPVAPTKNGHRILRRIVAMVAVTAGGFAAFALMVTPTRLSGASRSVRLRWQQRQREIQEVVAAATSPEVSAPSARTEVIPPKPTEL